MGSKHKDESQLNSLWGCVCCTG